MGNHFTRNTRNVLDASKQRLDNMEQNDMISDSDDIYIHNHFDLFPITKALLNVTSDDSITVRQTAKNIRNVRVNEQWLSEKVSEYELPQLTESEVKTMVDNGDWLSDKVTEYAPTGDTGDASIIIEQENVYDADYTDYPMGTITMFPVSYFAGYPFSGTLTTVNIGGDGYIYQEIQQSEWHTKAIRYLSWAGEWSDWTNLIGIVLNTVNETSPLTDYQYGESVTTVMSGQGWSLGIGTVKTIRPTNISNFGRQLFFSKDNDNIYTRRELDGGWTDWKQIQMVD